MRNTSLGDIVVVRTS